MHALRSPLGGPRGPAHDVGIEIDRCGLVSGEKFVPAEGGGGGHESFLSGLILYLLRGRGERHVSDSMRKKYSRSMPKVATIRINA